jgi:Ca2+/Na+ antiporter
MNQAVAFTLLAISTMMLVGCELVGDIFQAGVWVGVILVILVVGLVVWLFSRGRT